MAGTFRYLIITPFLLCAGITGAQAKDGEVTYTNPRTQAISNLLQILAAESKNGEAGQGLTKEEVEQLIKTQKPIEQEEQLDPYRKPVVTPVQVAPRVVASDEGDSDERKKEKKQPVNYNSTGGIGNVGGLGQVGSPNITDY